MIMLDNRAKLEIAAVAAFLVALWYVSVPSKQPVGQWVTAPPAATVAHVGTEEVPCTKLTVLKPEAKQKLGIAGTPDTTHVAGTTNVKPGEHSTTVVSTIDTVTGKTSIMTRVEPYPWFAAQQRGELRFDLGLKNAGNKVGRFTLHEDVLQVKGINVGVNLSADTDRAFFLGAGAGFRW